LIKLNVMKKIIVICVLILTIFACEKNIESSIEGNYIGHMHSNWSSYSPHYGFQEGDTVYVDTFIVKFVKEDSIFFIHKNSVRKFLRNETNIYGDTSGYIHYGNEYRLIKDSLFYKEWSNGGAGSSYNRSLITFEGSKNN